jgi:hypothetical protein
MKRILILISILTTFCASPSWGSFSFGAQVGGRAVTVTIDGTFQGAYVAETTYAANDIVSSSSINYKSLAGSNVGHTPASSATWWQAITVKGDTGATGIVGPTGVGIETTCIPGDGDCGITDTLNTIIPACPAGTALGKISQGPLGIPYYCYNGTPYAMGSNSYPSAGLPISIGTDWGASLTCTDGQIPKKVSGAWACAADSTATDTGYVSVPTYSDETCTAGQYSSDASYNYDCYATNAWTKTAATTWNNSQFPTFVSATIPSNGLTTEFVFSKNTSVGSGGSGGVVETLSGGANTLTYTSGAGSTTLIFTNARTVLSGETGTYAYTQPSDGLEATTGGFDVASASSLTVTNISTASGTTYTDCSQLGSHMFYWNGDHASGTTYGCKSEATVNGTLSSATVVASGTDPGTASPTSAGNVLKIDTSNGYLRWAITAADIINTSEGKMCFDLYPTISTSGITMELARNSSTNHMTLGIRSDNKLSFDHVGNSVDVQVISSTTFTDATWTPVCIRWSVTNNQVGISLNGGNLWDTDADADTVTAFTSAATYLYINYATVPTSHVYYFDNLVIDSASGL